MPVIVTPQLRMHYRTSGSGSQTMLFLHGNFASSLWWEKVMVQMPPAWRAVAPDMRGFGQSDKPPAGYTVDQLAEDVSSLVGKLELNDFVLVGHSLGGAVALSFTLDHQERVRALVLLDPVPAGGLRFDEEILRGLSGIQNSRAALGAGMKISAPTAPEDDFFSRLVDEALIATPQAFHEILASVTKFDVVDRLPQLRVPVLCVMGELDALIPRADVIKMQTRIPNCRVEIMGGVGHSPQVEAPRDFLQLLLGFADGARKRAGSFDDCG